MHCWPAAKMKGVTMKLMVCYDGSNIANDAIDTAVKLGKQLEGSVSLVRTMSAKRSEDVVRVEGIEADLESARKRVADTGLAVDAHLLIRGGSAGEDLTAFAKENDVEYIVIGIKRRSKVGKMFFGSTAQYVILKAVCPVITVK
jgi:nucleotide-binding universal stress UspA family protein